MLAYCVPLSPLRELAVVSNNDSVPIIGIDRQSVVFGCSRPGKPRLLSGPALMTPCYQYAPEPSINVIVEQEAHALSRLLGRRLSHRPLRLSKIGCGEGRKRLQDFLRRRSST